MATISEKLTHLTQTKALIKSVIGYRGMTIASGTPFADYADAILNLGGYSLERGLVAHLPLHNNGSDRKSYYDSTSVYPPVFDGITSSYTGTEYLECANNPFYNGTTQLMNFGFSVWLKGSSLTSASISVPIAFGTSGAGEIQIGDGGVNYLYIHGVGYYGQVLASDAGVTSAGDYYCLTVSIKNGYPYLYVNGKPIPLSYSSITANSTTTFAIGCRTSTIDYFFSGSITNLRLYNRSLSDDDAAQLYAEGAFLSHSPIQPPSTEKLDLFYPLVGNGDDLSGNTWHLTEYNMTVATTTEFGYAQTLNGTTSYLQNSSFTYPDLSKGATVSVWVYGGSITDTTSGAYPSIFSFGSTFLESWLQSNEGYLIFAYEGNIYSISKASAGLTSDTTWYHLLFTKYEYSPGVWIPALYVNGVVKTLSLVNTASYTPANGIALGVRAGSSYYYSGKLRNFRFYSRGFEAEEAENLYLYEKHNRDLSPTRGLLASYSLLSNGKDYFANKRDLTSYNSVTYTGEVANFSGSNYLYRNHTGYILATDAYLSVSFWVNPTSWQNGRVWYITDLNGYNYFYFSNTPTTGRWQLAVGRAGGSGISILPDNNSLGWTHFVAVIETAVGGTIQLYKNGVLIGTATTPNYSPRVDSTRIFVGADTGGNYKFTGKMSMLKVYTSYLSKNDVEYLYETQRHKYLPEG